MLEKLLKMTQTQTHNAIISVLKKHKIPYAETDLYIVTAQHKSCPLICTHLDTVGVPVKYVVKQGAIWRAPPLAPCLGADDRVGVWMALQMIIKGTCTKFNYGFFHDEEKGGIGSRAYLDGDHTCFIGLDRASKAGVQNIATYGYDDDELTGMFGYPEQYGTMSDCSILAAEHNKACVNISVGYDLEHTKSEHLDTGLMVETLILMRSVVIPERDYPVIPISGWSRWPEVSTDATRKECLCNLCYDHAPLYVTSRGLYCADGLEYLDTDMEIDYDTITW